MIGCTVGNSIYIYIWYISPTAHPTIHRTQPRSACNSAGRQPVERRTLANCLGRCFSKAACWCPGAAPKSLSLLVSKSLTYRLTGAKRREWMGMGVAGIIIDSCGSFQWEFQDPKMEVLYHIRPYFVGIFPYIGLT